MNMKDVKQIGARLTNGGKSKPAIDAGAIRELADLLAETGLTEIEIEQSGVRMRVSRQVAPVFAHGPAPASAPVTSGPAATQETPATKPAGPAAGAVPSPMVGTVYVSPEPGKPAFVKVGDTVKEGDTLLIVEAMKTMNPILAPRAGKITEICIRDAQPVEFGQSLMIIA
ncbi:MAG TPA: acetyl-CoA carboxylase biotin carboxyl carrier protein [Rhizomicrobium sp.]|nr:acetyl-CoA carboxylase biotin carboxyl carrier protein [Rhizomicrobium sp.]